jgi:hypothetical protein
LPGTGLPAPQPGFGQPGVGEPPLAPMNPRPSSTPGATSPTGPGTVHIPPPVGATGPSVAIAPPIATPIPTRPADGTGTGRPPASRPPRVVQFDEQIVRVARPDESYRTLSGQFYGSDEYAQALQLYNVEYPQSKLRRDGTLAPGDVVYVPDIHKLETTYGDKIPTVMAERARANGQPPQ